MIFILIFLTLICQILNEEYDLSDGKKQNVEQLLATYTYAFYIKAKEGKKLKVNLFWDYSEEKLFDCVYVYEHNSRNGGYLHSDSYYLSYSDTSYSFTYSIWSFSTEYVSVEIKPSNTVYNFSIIIDVSGTPTTTVILLATLIPFIVCFCFFFVCMLIICRNRHKNPIIIKTNNQINTSPQPLYNNLPLVQYTPPQAQYSPQYPPHLQYAPIQPQGNQQYMAPGQLYQ